MRDVLLTANRLGVSPMAFQVLRRVFAAEEGKRKRMVVMVGPPAAGKGFFVGDPTTEAGYGWKFPDSTHGLFKKEDVPRNTEYDESDNHLKMIQRDWGRKNHKALLTAHKNGPSAFNDTLKDMWYETKDGKRVDLKDTISHDSFDENFDKFHEKANKDFYVSMRGWHDEAKKKNSETGKPKERFKDKARHRFDDAINAKIDSTDRDMLIVDSAGEDIDAQDFKAQIERAKDASYDTTVIFLHPEKADTELSNLARGKIQGKRMVDQSDIDNWYKKNEQALKNIQGADPDNFLHYRKPPPDPDPEKAAKVRKRARELMEKLPSPPVQEKGEEEDAFKARQEEWKTTNKSALDEVSHTLYKAAPYPKDPEKSTSWGRSLDHERVPEKPQGDVAKAVSEMNEDAERRHKQPHEEPKKEEPAGASDGDGASKTRMDFLHEMGDKKVPNPNPKSKERWPEVQVRSLDWKQQKPYYERWRKTSRRVIERHLLPLRVAERYERIVMAEENDDSYYQDRIDDIARDVKDGLKGSEYPVQVKMMKGPLFFLTFEGGEGDTSTAHDLRTKVQKLVDAGLKKHIGEKGFKSRVDFSSKREDLVAEVEILFP